ncbi:MAG: hypothetical protein VW274_01865 [Thalassolituus sp.]
MQIVSGGFHAPEPATSQRAEIPQHLKSSSSYSHGAYSQGRIGDESSGVPLSDTVSISAAASRAAVSTPGNDTANPETKGSGSESGTGDTPDYEAEQIRELQARDLEVRNH